MKRFGLLTVLPLIFVAVVWLLNASFRQHRIDRGIEFTRAGMTEAEVVTALGRPGEIRPCQSLPRDPSCKHELVYYPPFELVSYWTVSIDVQGHVADKYHWQSS